MAEIRIAELNIDTGVLIKSVAEVKKKLDELKQKQKDLTNASGDNSEALVENAANMRQLAREYNAGLRTIVSHNDAISDQANRTDLLSVALESEATSIAEAREQNKLLNKLRNETNVTTEEGRAELEALNARLDQNNEFIRENADQYLQQKINIGNYTESIKGALAELNPLNGGMASFTQRANEAGGTGALLKNSLQAAGQGMLSLTKASLAFIATPVGAVIAALVAVFALVKNAMNRSEAATNKITKVFSVFGGMVNKVLGWLQPLGEFLIDKIVAGFELAGKAADSALKIISSGLELLGFDNAAKNVDKFSNGMKEAAKSAIILADAEAQLTKQQRLSEKIQLDFQKQAEKLRQIRDDESKSMAIRIKANKDLGKVLKQQSAEELKIANLSLSVTNQRLKLEGQTTANLDAQAEAAVKISEIQERITSQESEQLTNLNSLKKEATQKDLDAKQKILDTAVSQSKAELDLFLSEQGIKEKGLQDNLNLAREISAKKLEIAQKEFEATKQTEVDKINFQAAQNEIKKELLIKEAELVAERVAKDKEIQDLAREQKKEQEALDLENKLLANENDLAIQQEHLESKRKLEVANAERVGADVELINKKYLNAKEKLELQSTIAQVSNAQNAIGAVGQLNKLAFNENKGLSTALAGIDAVLGTQKAYLSQLIPGDPTSFPRAVLAGVQAGLTGAANVAKVSGVKFAGGGFIGIDGKSHSMGGEPVHVGSQYVGEAQGGEGIAIMNRGAFSQFRNFNNTYGDGDVSRNGFFAGGGIITKAVSSSKFDVGELADLTVKAIQSIPAPIVTVEDINIGQGSVAVTESLANF